MKTAPMRVYVELICTLAGPMGSLLLLLFRRLLPCTAVCALFQLVYNMLPIFPMDGGRVVYCILEMLIGQYRAKAVYGVVEIVFFIAMFLLSVFLFINHLGPIPLVFTVILFLKTRKENPLANGPK